MEELEIMRHQLAAMKQQLDTQRIVNHDLMRKVMRGKASWLNRYVKAELIALPFIFLLYAGICYVYGISQWFSVILLICAGIDALFDRRTIRIPAHLFSSSSMLELKKFLLRQRKERFIQTCVGSIFVVVFFMIFFHELSLSTSPLLECSDLLESAKTGGLIGGIIGGIVGIVVLVAIYRKIRCTNEALLRDIDELQKE